MSEQTERKPRQRRTPRERAEYELEVAIGREARAVEAAKKAADHAAAARAANEAAAADLVLARKELQHAREHPALQQAEVDAS